MTMLAMLTFAGTTRNSCNRQSSLAAEPTLHSLAGSKNSEFMRTNVRYGYAPENVKPYKIFLKRSDLGPAIRPEIFVFTDVHEDFLDFCTFGLSYDPQAPDSGWHNLPSGRHAGSGILSYVDGHAETHRWRDRITLQPVTGIEHLGLLAPGSKDFNFVWERTTRSKYE